MNDGSPTRVPSQPCNSAARDGVACVTRSPLANLPGVSTRVACGAAAQSEALKTHASGFGAGDAAGTSDAELDQISPRLQYDDACEPPVAFPPPEATFAPASPCSHNTALDPGPISAPRAATPSAAHRERAAASAPVPVPGSARIGATDNAQACGSLLSKVLNGWSSSPPASDQPCALLGGRIGSDGLAAKTHVAHIGKRTSGGQAGGASTGKRADCAGTDENCQPAKQLDSLAVSTPAPAFAPATPAIAGATAGPMLTRVSTGAATSTPQPPADALVTPRPAHMLTTDAETGAATISVTDNRAALLGRSRNTANDKAVHGDAPSPQHVLSPVTAAHCNAALLPALGDAPSPFKPSAVSTKPRSVANRKRSRAAVTAPSAAHAMPPPPTFAEANIPDSGPEPHTGAVARPLEPLSPAVRFAHAATLPMPLFKPSPPVSLFLGQQPHVAAGPATLMPTGAAAFTQMCLP